MTDAAASPALRCANVSVTLSKTPIVRDVSLEVQTGEWVSIIGPNGAGKSTLLRSIMGLTKFSGSIDILGRSIDSTTNRERAAQLAAVPQTQVIPPGMRAFDYVLLGRNPWIAPLGRESADDIKLAQESMEQLDVAHLQSRFVDELSGGERQRVIIARALAQRSPILVLDEPTTSLDIGHQQELLNLLEGLRQSQGLTLITTMHDLTLSGLYADRLFLMSCGEMVASGTATEVLTNDHITTIYRASVRVMHEEDGTILVVPLRSEPTAPNLSKDQP